MTIIRKLRGKFLHKEISERIKIYDNKFNLNHRLDWQLEKFNKLWRNISKSVPYYKNMLDEKKLPKIFNDWEEFRNIMPSTDRDKCKSYLSELIDQRKKHDFWRVTGGSSAKPIKLPAWNSEIKETRSDQWLGRSWYGINPEDRCFFIWGHAHLFGGGIQGFLNHNKRKFKDKILGYHRFPAYNLSVESLTKAGDEILKFKPEYIIGYSVALDMFARVNYKRQEDFQRLELKAVIASTENFPSENSSEIISKVFNSPVVMEYGSVETDAIAYTDVNNIYKTFWRNYFIEVIDNDFGKEILITSLYPRCFPLIRYNLGDIIELTDNNNNLDFGISEFEKIIGRKNEIITLKDGNVFHIRSLTQAVRGFSEISGTQLVIKDNEIVLNIIDRELELTDKSLSTILLRLTSVHNEFRKIQIKRVSNLEQTISGKTPLVLNKNNYEIK
jgi:phenylacetate-CoA ligase